MALVTLSTIYQTIFISLILLLSKGWSIARSSLARQDLSTITLMMGAIYLVYSAFYVSINIEGMKLFISVVLNALYLVLWIVVTKNALETRSLLKAQMQVIVENDIDTLYDAISLKVSIMNKFLCKRPILHTHHNHKPCVGLPLGRLRLRAPEPPLPRGASEGAGVLRRRALGHAHLRSACHARA